MASRSVKIIWLVCIATIAGCTTLWGAKDLATHEQLAARAATFEVVKVVSVTTGNAIPPPREASATDGKMDRISFLLPPDAAFVFAQPTYPQMLKTGGTGTLLPSLDFMGWALLVTTVIIFYTAVLAILDEVMKRWRRWRRGRG